MPQQGDRYINKYYFDLNKDWTLESVNAKLQEMGLNFSGSDIQQGAFLLQQSRNNRSLVIYTHRTQDVQNLVRRNFVTREDLEWYTSRGWVEVEGGKLEIPY